MALELSKQALRHAASLLPAFRHVVDSAKSMRAELQAKKVRRAIERAYRSWREDTRTRAHQGARMHRCPLLEKQGRMLQDESCWLDGIIVCFARMRSALFRTRSPGSPGLHRSNGGGGGRTRTA